MERKLAAILAADVVGYSALMERDEKGTFARLKAHRTKLLEPAIKKHHGRVFKLMGDGLLAEFGSAVDAVECAVAVQKEMAKCNDGAAPDERIDLRIGVNLGDVIVEGEDIHGEGVNIAARLEALAKPGGICISAKVHDEVHRKIDCSFEDMGDQSVKNIARPLRAYRLSSDKVVESAPAARPALSLLDKPSIAILPFQNMSGDPEQEYFADGMVEEIITALSRMRWLFVIARNSSFTYKGRAVDVKQAGRELGVRYVLQGSVRKAANRVRITGQLVDASTGAHLWADRFDGQLEDVFDLQDQVTASVVAAISPRLEQAEIERSRHKPTERLDAYDFYLRGLAFVHQRTKSTIVDALAHFYKAIELDPGFASAYGMAARCYSMRKVGGWVEDPLREIAEADRLARRAAELGRDDAVALATAGIALSFVVGDLDRARELVDRATALDPNMAWAWLFSGWTRVWLGEPEVAIEQVARALRLSPLDPHRSSMFAAMASAYFFVGRYDEALSWAERAARGPTGFLFSTAMVAASAALTGDLVRAREAVDQLRSDHPDMSISVQSLFLPLRRSKDIERFAEGLRQAGLPE